MAEAEAVGVALMEVLPAVAEAGGLAPMVHEGMEEAIGLSTATIRMVRRVLEREGEMIDPKLLNIGNMAGAVLLRIGIRAAEGELRAKQGDALGQLLAIVKAEAAKTK